MRFRTETDLLPSDWRISHHSPLLLAGSCFSERMGDRLKADKFPVHTNPFGVIYHPVPLLRGLSACAETDAAQALKALQQNTFEREGLWRNFLTTGDLAGATREAADQNIADAYTSTRQFLQETDYLVLTFGTAFGYQLKSPYPSSTAGTEAGEIVANCHKLPAAHFEKVLSSPEELLASVKPLLQQLIDARPGLRVLVTVSPVRHIRDGLVQDRLSKSALLWLCHLLTQAFAQVRYFPSYEMVTDDLRDYRFFEADLVHPNAQAVEYIHEQFARVFWDEETAALVQRWQAIRRDLEHRPLFPGTEQYRSFLRQLKEKLEQLPAVINTEEEVRRVNALLNGQEP